MRQQTKSIVYGLLTLILLQCADTNQIGYAGQANALPRRPGARPCCLLASHAVMPWALFPWLDDVFDPSDNLAHHYGAGTWSYIGRAEVDGLAYTCSVGLLDLGHLRHVADLAYYYYRWLATVTKPGDGLETVGHSGRLELLRRLPKGDLNLRLQLAQSAAYDESIFYEIETYWSKRTGEHHSAFSPEDMVSNLVGTYVAARAIRAVQAEELDFDTAMTQALSETLDRLGAVPAEETRRALFAVEGAWFAGSPQTLTYLQRRNFAYDPVKPWRLGGIKSCADRALFLDPIRPLPRLHRYYAVSYKLPRIFTNVMLRSRLEISPGFDESLENASAAYVSSRDFARQIGRIKAHARAVYGPRFDRANLGSVKLQAR